ncbi:MAG: hypothetical protein ABSF00_01750 [Candidatus Bathyarchaeia archaeon]
MARQSRLPIRINRKAPSAALLPFTDYFKGFDNVGAMRGVFGEKTDSVLDNLKVGFVSNRRMYMGIRDKDGNIAVSTFHLKHSDQRTLYLDVVHELFHVKQFIENRKYFREEHQKFMGNRSLYYVSPIEVPAYKHTVKEAKRIGMSFNEIAEYLKMGPVPPKVFNKFLKTVNLERGGNTSKNRARLAVRINRYASIRVFPFTDYFKGFEKSSAVRALFGNKTEKILGKLKVEFADSPFRTIFPSDEDGHLMVSLDYFRKGDVNSLYLNVLLCLNILKRLSEDKLLLESNDQEFGESPVILESYKSMLAESRRIGMSDKKILESMQLPRFMMSPAGYIRFVRKLGLLDSG